MFAGLKRKLSQIGKLAAAIAVIFGSFSVPLSDVDGQQQAMLWAQQAIPGLPAELVRAGYRRYDVESGIIEYQVTGTQRGTQKLYFDHWGWREAKFIETEGADLTVRNIEILEGRWLTTVNLIDRSAKRRANPVFDQMMQSADNKHMGRLGLDLMRQMGGQVLRKENILGYPCDVWELKALGGRSWLWQHITLKTEVEKWDLIMNTTALSIDTEASLPPDIFALPSDISITEE